MQGVTRNPLADPGLLGVNAGAALAVVIGIYVFDVTSTSGYVWFAFAGAAVAGVFVYVLGAMGRGGATPVKLAIAGAACRRCWRRSPRRCSSSTRPRSTSTASGRSARSPVATSACIGAGRCRSSRRHGARPRLGPGAQRPGARRGRRPLARPAGRLVRAVAAARSCCCAAAPPPPPGRSLRRARRAPRRRAITGPDHRWLLPYSMLWRRPAGERRRDRPGRRPAGRARGRHRHRLHRRAGLHRLRPSSPDRGALSVTAVTRSTSTGRSRRARRCSTSAPFRVRIGVVSARSTVARRAVVARALGGRGLRRRRGASASATSRSHRRRRRELTGLGGNPRQRVHHPHPAPAPGAHRHARRRRVRRLGPDLPAHGPNPLASPDILGVSSGAAAAAVFAIIVLAAADHQPSPPLALGGAGPAVAAIYLLAVKQGVSSYRLVLVGIGITALLDAGVAYLLTRAEIYDAQRATVWLTGSLNGRGWEYVTPAHHRARGAACRSRSSSARQLRALELGDDAATASASGSRRSKLVLTLAGAGAGRGRHRGGRARSASWPSSRRRSPAASSATALAAADPRRPRRRRDRGQRRPRRPGGCSPRPSSRSAWSPPSSARPYLLWLLARANRIGTGG